MNTDGMRRMSLTIAAAAAIVLLAGCATAAAPESSPTASPSTAPASTPSPTATPEADPADPTTWIISGAGIGPVDVGGDFAATLATLPDSWTNDDVCEWSAWWMSDDPSYGVYFVRGTESDTAPISEMSVYSAAEDLTTVTGPRTAEGLGVGSTADELIAAYPDAEQGTAEIGSITWLEIPGDAAGNVFFQFREGETQVSSVVVTSREAPSYEVCG